MISSRKELRCYLAADKFALGITHSFPHGPNDSVWRYERTLRFYEYHRNVGHVFLRKIYGYLLAIRGQRLGFSISANCFGPGLRINHTGLLVVNAKARIGKWCDIHQGVNIGENGFVDDDNRIVSEVPTIGNFCFIGPGAKIFGASQVGDFVRIGANAIVDKDVPDKQIVIGHMIINVPRRNNLTIASEDTEQEFLKIYPQYKEILLNL